VKLAVFVRVKRDGVEVLEVWELPVIDESFCEARLATLEEKHCGTISTIEIDTEAAQR